MASISYEYDPTDALKMPQLLAEANNEVYVKQENEDFMTILSGALGQKKRIIGTFSFTSQIKFIVRNKSIIYFLN